MFVIPSVEETFGLPLVEAMGAGLPIAASDCRLAADGGKYFNPFREIAGDAAEYFNPLDETSISRLMQRLLSDPALCKNLAERARARVTRFGWHRTARDTVKLFNEMARAIAQ